MNHYQVLGVPSHASYDEIKRAFYQLARRTHPDRQPSKSLHDTLMATTTTTTSTTAETIGGTTTSTILHPTTKHTFERIQQAWECLRSNDTRQAYDEQVYIEQSQSVMTKSAMDLSLQDDFQTAIMVEDDDDDDVHDDTNELAYVYDCRCGEEIHVYPDDHWNPNRRLPHDTLIMECPGCCLIYRIHR